MTTPILPNAGIYNPVIAKRELYDIYYLSDVTGKYRLYNVNFIHGASKAQEQVDHVKRVHKTDAFAIHHVGGSRPNSLENVED